MEGGDSRARIRLAGDLGESVNAVPLARKNHEEKPDVVWQGIGLGLAKIRSDDLPAAEAYLRKLQPSPVHLEQRAMIDVCLAMSGMEPGRHVSDLIRRSEGTIAKILPRPDRERDAWHDAIYVQAMLGEIKGRITKTK